MRQEQRESWPVFWDFCCLSLCCFLPDYFSAELDHVCLGEDCPICAEMAQCESSLRRAGSGAFIPLSAVTPVFFLFLCSVSFAFSISQATPVSSKVRLNN
jgi:hypothetical protein